MNPNRIQPVLEFTVKNYIFEKGKQTVWGDCLLKGIKFLVFICKLMYRLTGAGDFVQTSGPVGLVQETSVTARRYHV